MFDSVREKLIGALQRDRLSNFFKEVDPDKTGCFYFSLISSHNRLHPNSLISKELESRLLERGNEGYGVKLSELYSEVERLKSELGLELDSVVVLNGASEDSVRALLEIPSEIKVSYLQGKPNFSTIAGKSTSIVFLGKAGTNTGHYIPIDPNPRFKGAEALDGLSFGGQAEYDSIKKDYKPEYVFNLKNKE